MKYSKNNIYIVFIVSIITLVLCFLYETYNIIESLNEYDPNIKIVVSRYNEDLEWLKKEQFNKFPVVCYNKGPNSDFYKPDKMEIIEKENVGMNIHTYLDYIINNYDNLPDIVVFLSGSCMDNGLKRNITLKTMEVLSDIKNSVFVVTKYPNSIHIQEYNWILDEYNVSNSNNVELNIDNKLQPCKIRPFGRWYETLFPGIDINIINLKSIFAVSKEHIHSRSKDSYQELISYVNTNVNEESAHYFERAMMAVFYPIPEKCLVFHPIPEIPEE
jgi:hypothetical protein